MSGFLGSWIATFLAVLLVSYLLPFVRTTPTSAAIFALVLGLLNAFVLPVLRVLTLPFTILTLGLFLLLLNLFMFWLAERFVPGIQIGGGFVGLVLAALAVSITGGLVRGLFGGR
jgi:putative membrane protein